MRLLLALGLASLLLYSFAATAHATELGVEEIEISILNFDRTPANFYGWLEVRYSVFYRQSIEVENGRAYLKLPSYFPKKLFDCINDTECFLEHTVLKIYVEPGEIFPTTLVYKLTELNASITKAVKNRTLYINITLPMRLNTPRICVYTEAGVPVPNALITSAGGERKTGDDGCTSKPILITDKHNVTVRWGESTWSIELDEKSFHAATVNVTLPVPLSDKFSLRIVSRDGKPLTVFVSYPGPGYPRLCVGVCNFTLSDVGRAILFFENLHVPLTVDRIVNGSFIVLDVDAIPLNLCVYSDDGRPLAFHLDIAASTSTPGYTLFGKGQLKGRGCGEYYFPSVPKLGAWVSYERGSRHLAKPLKISVPGNYTLYVDITPPIIDRVWVNATWVTMFGTRCLDILLYVEARDPNERASGVKEVRAGFSKDPYLMRVGDYLGGNKWRVELGCPRHAGAIRTIYIHVADKNGNDAELSLQYKIEPGTKWLLGSAEEASPLGREQTVPMEEQQAREEWEERSSIASPELSTATAGNGVPIALILIPVIVASAAIAYFYLRRK